MRRLGLIVQARMGSSRLPGKVLEPIGDRILLSHVFGRLELLKHDVQSIVATTNDVRDDVIADWATTNGVLCFRGDENDVLDRYFRCATQYEFDTIIRLTADNPFTDMDELDRLIEFHTVGGFDYAHSFGELPIGVGAEIMSFDALARSHSEGQADHHREHVNEYIQENPQIFGTGVLEPPAFKRAPKLRLTIDTPEDLLRARWLVERKMGPWLTTEEAIRLCSHFA
jgi:spore coat polysaccharide biosynthesis protein SpsF